MDEKKPEQTFESYLVKEKKPFPGLVSMSVKEIVEKWRPGSHDDLWTWADECRDLWNRDRVRTEDLWSAIRQEGFELADATAPIKLGNDGRVWNGHHRICIALWCQQLLESYGQIIPILLNVDIVGPEEKE